MILHEAPVTVGWNFFRRSYESVRALCLTFLGDWWSHVFIVHHTLSLRAR